MGVNIEVETICKIIETRDLQTAVTLKIDESFFLSNSQAKEAFKFINEHYHNEHTYGAVPSWDLIQQRFYGFPWVYSYDTLATLCQELRRHKIRAQLLTMVDEVSQVVDTEPGVAMGIAREVLNRMSAEHEISSHMLLSGAFEKLQTEYEMLANAHGVIGIPFPWDILNDDTLGMQASQFIVLYGRPKSMKTWVAMCIAVYAYLKNKRVLIWSLEMNEAQMLRRITSIIAQVDYDKYKKAKLDPATTAKLWQILSAIQNEEVSRTNTSGHSPAMMVVHPRGDANGINSLQAKIREFKPDIVFVDGMYLMKDDRQKVRSIDWKAIAHISQDLKRTASQFQIPLIGITQANRGADKDPKKADLAELAYSDALAQDCDLCLRIHKQKDPSTQEGEIVISVAGGRETQLDGFVINAIPSTNFGFKRAFIQDPNNSPQGPKPPSSSNASQDPRNAAPILPRWGS